ncbi:MAG: RdgB/HAM1 family non-canonical purine NTP pyrophosphatase [Planctomycetes bacterium]|nr:RdgB/HAM1 family non-canonical purine NTP pyrophosphatase [Planctomycetota bacterium]
MELLLASGNAKKLAEVRGLLEPLGVRVLAPQDVGGLPEVIEDRPDFAGNASKKAVEAAQHTGRWCLADDSGLEVDALDGAPGVFSARYAGEPSDDARNNAKLLEDLRGVPEPRRGARFVCALALADPAGRVVELVLGTARGRILEHARGTRDFGYDPLFLFTEEGHPETGRGFAELEPAEKAAVSHRGRALRELLAKLPAHLGARH